MQAAVPRELSKGLLKKVRDELVTSEVDSSEMAELSQFLHQNERFPHRRLMAC